MLRSLTNRIGRHVALLAASVLPPPRIIMDREGSSPYLSRYYVLGGPRGEDAFDELGSPKLNTVWKELPFNVYLHKFHRGDDDAALHNHPWRWSFSVILAGGYVEYRRHGLHEVRERRVLPGTVNVIRGDDYHRVDLIEKDAWSLFVAGPRSQSWSFWDPQTGEVIPWREFIDRRRGLQTTDEIQDRESRIDRRRSVEEVL